MAEGTSTFTVGARRPVLAALLATQSTGPAASFAALEHGYTIAREPLRP
jgi:hypothetical protein